MFEIITLLAVAFGVAGIILAAFKLFGRKPPKYAIPLAAGLSMLGYSIWNDYTWHDRTVDVLPDQIVVLERFEYKAPWQPWTYLFPRIDSFAAVDRGSIRQNADRPEYVLVDTLLIKRHGDTLTATRLLDCRKHRYANITSPPRFGEEGHPLDMEWFGMDPDDKLLAVACAS